MRHLKRHEEVLKLTCGLMSRPAELIEQVCDALSSYINEFEVSGDIDDRLLKCFCFVEALCKELPQLETTDATNCKTVVSFAGNASFVFIPQRFDECFVALLQTPVKPSERECAVVVNNVHGFNSAYLERFCEKLARNVTIAISSLLVVNDDNCGPESVHARRLINNVRLFKSPKVFVMQNCTFTPALSASVAKQLCICDEIRFVCLNNVRNVPESLCTALIKRNADHLRGVQIEKSVLIQGQWSELASQLNQCNQLEYLNFTKTKRLPSNFYNLFANFPYRFSSSSWLNSLSLSETQLAPEDVKFIGTSLRWSLRFLRRLCVSFNTLTNCVADLIPDNEQLDNLEVLWMQRTKLSLEDVKHLGQAVISGSLPSLASLDLSENDLFTMEGDFENLILACTAQYRKRHMGICLKNNFLSEEFLSRIETICQGTRVVPTSESPTSKSLVILVHK